MFGLGKRKIPLNEVAGLLAQTLIMPIENPSEQDLSFRAEATKAGVDKNRFTFEAVALQAYAMAAAINSERLAGKLDSEKAELLIVGFMRDFNDRLRNSKHLDSLPQGLDPDEALELMSVRATRYSEPAWGHGSMHDVPRFFAEFCGVTESDALQRIGGSLMQARGNYYLDWLRTLKIE